MDRKGGKYEANADVNDVIINRDNRETLQWEKCYVNSNYKVDVLELTQINNLIEYSVNSNFSVCYLKEFISEKQ